MMSIEALMNRKVVTAGAREAVAQVAARMKEASVGAVVLVDGEKACGIFSERDLLQRVVAAGKDPASTDVGSVASHELVSVAPGTSLRECAETLKSRKMRHLPVIEAGRVVGIISARDFFEAVSGELERFIERSRYEKDLRDNVDPYDHLGGSYGR